LVATPAGDQEDEAWRSLGTLLWLPAQFASEEPHDAHELFEGADDEDVPNRPAPGGVVDCDAEENLLPRLRRPRGEK